MKNYSSLLLKCVLVVLVIKANSIDVEKVLKQECINLVANQRFVMDKCTNFTSDLQGESKIVCYVSASCLRLNCKYSKESIIRFYLLEVPVIDVCDGKLKEGYCMSDGRSPTKEKCGIV